MRARLMPIAAAAASALVLTACGGTATDDASQIVRTTTNIAGAGVIGLERDTTTACPEASPAEGADPQRIVVLSTQALDTVCALGLWERVVGAATLDGPVAQPGYLGSGIALIPSVGPLSAPDTAKIAALTPDLIVGTTPWTPYVQDELSTIAPTVFAGKGSWQQQVLRLAGALGRPAAAEQALEDYRRAARDTGTDLTSSQTEASVVRFTPDEIKVEGSDSFAGQVLADAGVRRPADQRGDTFDVPASDLKEAEGDLIYVLLAGDKGKEHGTDVMKGEGWKSLGAATDRRVFAVDDAVWTGGGIVAARAVLADLTASLNGYVTG